MKQQDLKKPTKPRSATHQAAIQATGSGAHKDKKAALKRGEVKHKKDLTAVDESTTQVLSKWNCENIEEMEQLVELYEDWQKVNKKDKTDGMSSKAVKAYRRENPGSKLKTAVTTKPSKLKKGSKDAKRRKSFCARMSGMKKAHASAKTKRDPDSPINKALRRWNCESIEEMQQLISLTEHYLNRKSKK